MMRRGGVAAGAGAVTAVGRVVPEGVGPLVDDDDGGGGGMVESFIRRSGQREPIRSLSVSDPPS